MQDRGITYEINVFGALANNEHWSESVRVDPIPAACK
jgi:hypothetical protein